MIISITGMKRSGSTWQYNVVRLFVTHGTGQKPLITATPNEAIKAEKTNPRAIVLCKYHPYNRELKNASGLIFTSSRPWEDALESLERFKGELPDKDRISRMKRWHAGWQKASDFNQTFSQLKYSSDALINLIGLKLYRAGVIPAFTSDLKSKVKVGMENLKTPDRETWYDSETLLFWNHITDEHNRA